MTDLEARCLDRFPEWLKSLAEDANALSALLDDPDLSEAARRLVAGALNYLFKSLDLIPDGIEDLGFLDDAFVFRVASQLAGADSGKEPLRRLASDAALLREFLEGDYLRLERFVSSLATSVARGRTVDEILSDASVRASFVGEVKGWSGSYVVPSFGRDAKNLVKLRSFLKAKLPA